MFLERSGYFPFFFKEAITHGVKQEGGGAQWANGGCGSKVEFLNMFVEKNVIHIQNFELVKKSVHSPLTIGYYYLNIDILYT